jgi:hypothetical protein
LSVKPFSILICIHLKIAVNSATPEEILPLVISSALSSISASTHLNATVAYELFALTKTINI